jgi:hypothetical protein
METRQLVDAIVRQTTVLIAQLSTVAGIRAPLAKVADQVFFDLAREIEAQGVSRKVAADMFGLALRSYQKKMQRLAQSKTDAGQTLWSAVFEYLRAQGGASRQRIDHHFRNDDALDLAAVLKDLITSGLVSTTGRGSSTYYAVSSPEARAALASEGELEAITNYVWLAIYDHQHVARRELERELSYSPELCARAIEILLADGRIEQQGQGALSVLSCTQLSIPVGAEQGWEVAVLDHFRAAATAIGSKLRLSSTRWRQHDGVQHRRRPSVRGRGLRLARARAHGRERAVGSRERAQPSAAGGSEQAHRSDFLFWTERGRCGCRTNPRGRRAWSLK